LDGMYISSPGSEHLRSLTVSKLLSFCVLGFSVLPGQDYEVDIRWSMMSVPSIEPFIQIHGNTGEAETVLTPKVGGTTELRDGIRMEMRQAFDRMENRLTITIPRDIDPLVKFWVKSSFSERGVDSQIGLNECKVVIKDGDATAAYILVSQSRDIHRKILFKYTSDDSTSRKFIPTTDGLLLLGSILPAAHQIILNLTSYPYPGIIIGRVWNRYTGQPIPNAKVILDGDDIAYTDSSGQYHHILEGAGDHSLYAEYEEVRSKQKKIRYRDIIPYEVHFNLPVIESADIETEEPEIFTKTYDFHFLYNSSTLAKTEHNSGKVEELLDDLKQYALASFIRIVGHTDSDGPSEYNLQLSYERAISVRNELKQLNCCDISEATSSLDAFRTHPPYISSYTTSTSVILTAKDLCCSSKADTMAPTY